MVSASHRRDHDRLACGEVVAGGSEFKMVWHLLRDIYFVVQTLFTHKVKTTFVRVKLTEVDILGSFLEDDVFGVNSQTSNLEDCVDSQF